jgi:hypothetical protein
LLLYYAGAKIFFLNVARKRLFLQKENDLCEKYQGLIWMQTVSAGRLSRWKGTAILFVS